MDNPIVLVASRSGPNIAAWDIATGCFLTAYKGGGSVANGLAMLGRHHLVAVQAASPALHFWTWHRGSLLQRCFAAEGLTCVTASEHGGLCAAGAASGRIYLWQTGSGRLLKSWSAHYKPVSAITFTEGGGVLVSGGEDALVHSWLLAHMADADTPPSVGLATAAFSWSSHTQAVTSLWAGIGGPAAGFVASASLDHTCRVYSLATGDELASFRLPAPLQCCQGDTQEQAMYLGGSDGSIFEVSLLGDAGNLSGKGPNRSEAGFFTQVGITPHHRLEGHAAAVSCLACTADGMQLVSGSEDSTVRMWDIATRQPLRTLGSPVKAAISALLVMDRPLHLSTSRGNSSNGISRSHGSGSNPGASRMMPLAAFQRYPDHYASWQGCPTCIDGAAPYRDIVKAAGLLSPPLHGRTVGVREDGLLQLSAAWEDDGNQDNTFVEQLQDEIDSLRTALERERGNNIKLAEVNANLSSLIQHPGQAAAVSFGRQS